MTLLPPVYRRLIAGFVGRRRVLVDELPSDRRPSSLAIFTGASEGGKLRDEVAILSYNIKRAERIDQVAASLTEAVDRHLPEIILIQEAPPEFVEHAEAVFHGRSVFFAPFHQVDRPDRRYRFRRYGQIIASSVAPRYREVIELPTVNPSTLGRGHTMKRIALYTELSISDGRVAGLVNVHNEPFTYPSRRLIQYEAMLSRVDGRSTDVQLIAGDLNPTLGKRSEHGIRRLESLGYEDSFPASRRMLDTCFARGHQRVLGAEKLPQRGSDHHPILVRVLL